MVEIKKGDNTMAAVPEEANDTSGRGVSGAAATDSELVGGTVVQKSFSEDKDYRVVVETPTSSSSTSTSPSSKEDEEITTIIKEEETTITSTTGSVQEKVLEDDGDDTSCKQQTAITTTTSSSPKEGGSSSSNSTMIKEEETTTVTIKIKQENTDDDEDADGDDAPNDNNEELFKEDDDDALQIELVRVSSSLSPNFKDQLIHLLKTNKQQRNKIVDQDKQINFLKWVIVILLVCYPYCLFCWDWWTNRLLA